MSFGERMQGFASNAEQNVKQTSYAVSHFLLSLVTGLMLGLTLGLIGQEFVGYGVFALCFAIVVVTALTLRGLKNWTMGKILIFDLFCILVAMLLRMYILVAP